MRLGGLRAILKRGPQVEDVPRGITRMASAGFDRASIIKSRMRKNKRNRFHLLGLSLLLAFKVDSGPDGARSLC